VQTTPPAAGLLRHLARLEPDADIRNRYDTILAAMDAGTLGEIDVEAVLHR